MVAQDEELRKMHIKLKANAISEGKTLRDTLTRPGPTEKRRGAVQPAHGPGHHRPGAKMPKETACTAHCPGHHRPGAKMSKENVCERVEKKAQPDLKSQAQPDSKSQAQPDCESQAQPDLKSQAQPDSDHQAERADIYVHKGAPRKGAFQSVFGSGEGNKGNGHLW